MSVAYPLVNLWVNDMSQPALVGVYTPVPGSLHGPGGLASG